MNPATGWTGRTACALQAALRLSNLAFAEHLGVGARTVAAWHQKPTLRPKSEIQQLLDTAFERAPEAAKERFAALVDDSAARADIGSTERAETEDAEQRLNADPNIGAALEWLDRHAHWTPGTSRREIAARLARLDLRELHDRANRRGQVDQRHVAHALGEFYRDPPPGYGRYAARLNDHGEAVTSVLTCPDWLDLGCALATGDDRLTLASAAKASDIEMDSQAAEYAVQRLAETLALGVRLVDMPLYRLFDVDVRRGLIGGSLGTDHFVRYAVTIDLLEGELIDALAAGHVSAPGSMPLRDRYLPDAASVLDTSSRLCAGGPLALCAIARPADPVRGRPTTCCWCRSGPAAC